MSTKDLIELIEDTERDHNDTVVNKITLEEAGLEEDNPTDGSFKHGIFTYLTWFWDGESSEWDE